MCTNTSFLTLLSSTWRFSTTSNLRWTTNNMPWNQSLEQTWIECRDNCHVFHTLCKDKITAKQRTARVAPAPWFFCYVFFFPLFFLGNSCPVTVWPYCCRHVAAVLMSSVKATFTNILEIILGQLGFRIWDINVLFRNSLKSSWESLFFVVLHYSSVVKTHAVKLVNVCKPPFNGWFKSPNFSRYNFRKKQNFRAKLWSIYGSLSK